MIRVDLIQVLGHILVQSHYLIVVEAIIGIDIISQDVFNLNEAFNRLGLLSW